MSPNIYQALAIKHALNLYARTGRRANRAYTPKAMLATASAITGHVYRRGQYAAAALGLQEWIDKQCSS